MTTLSPQILPLLPQSGDATDWQIGAAGTSVGQWCDDLGGMVCLAVQVRFMWGSGSGGVKLCIQSSLDQGTTAYDVAIINFAAASRSLIFSVVASTTGLILPGFGGLDASSGTESEGVITSVLGDRVRAMVVNSGLYTNTLLSCRIMAS